MVNLYRNPTTNSKQSDSTTTPLHCSGTFIGCESPSASSIDWPYLFFVAVTTLRLSTCRGTYTGSLTTTPATPAIGNDTPADGTSDEAPHRRRSCVWNCRRSCVE